MREPDRAEALHHAAMIVRAQVTSARKATTEELVRHLQRIDGDQPGYTDGIAEAVEEIWNAPPEIDRTELANRIDQRALRTLNP